MFKKKKMLLLIPQLRFGGAERVVSHLSFLLNKSFDLKIVVFDNDNITYPVGSQIISIDVPSKPNNSILKSIYNVLIRIKKFKKICDELGIDIVYSFGDTANLINILTPGRHEKVISIRGFKRVEKGTTVKEKVILKPISKFIFKKSDKIISVSKLISEKISNDNGALSSKIHTIYNGYDAEKIINKSKEPLTESELEIFDNNEIIITAGTFRYEKGYWHLLKAFKIAREKNERLKLVILGKDYNGYVKKVKKLISLLELDNHVYLLGFQENPYKYFLKSDMYILSSVFEGFPNSLVEAMCTGLPVIAFDCKSGPREILYPEMSLDEETKGIYRDGYGILIQRPNPIENWEPDMLEDEDYLLAESIIHMSDTQIRSHYSKKSLQKSKDFTLKKWKENHLKILG